MLSHLIIRTVLLCLLAAAPVAAEVTITESKDWFRVRGSEPSAVLASIRSQRGGNVVALTRSKHQLEYMMVGQGNRCRIEDVRLTVDITLVLPRWTEYRRAKPELRRAWDRFSDAILEHEKGHVRNARAAAYAIEQAVTGLKGHCSSLKVRANAKLELVQSRYQLKNQRYDQLTRHGQKQGVIFP